MPSGVYERKRWMKSAGKITPEVKEEIRGRRGEGESWTSIARGLEEKGLKLSRQSVRRAWVGEWNGSRRKVVACLRCGGDVTRGEKFCTKACKRIWSREKEGEKLAGRIGRKKAKEAAAIERALAAGRARAEEAGNDRSVEV